MYLLPEKRGYEFAIASGWQGHAIYIGLRKQRDGNISRVVYNLGQCLDAHPKTSDNRVYPHVIKDMPFDRFVDEDEDLVNYLKDVIYAKLGYSKSPGTLVYPDAKNLGGRFVTENIPGLPQKWQTAGNCVLKNNNVAVRNRMRNDRLFKFLKDDEKHYAKEFAKIEQAIYDRKERERDAHSFGDIVGKYIKSKNSEVAVRNLVRFLEKRLDIPEIRDLRPEERIPIYLTEYKDQNQVSEWLVNKKALQMLADIAENRYCESLSYFLKRYETANLSVSDQHK